MNEHFQRKVPKISIIGGPQSL